jgi:hypothetical protein
LARKKILNSAKRRWLDGSVSSPRLRMLAGLRDDGSWIGLQVRAAFIDRLFSAALVDADERDVGFKHLGDAAGIAILARHLDVIGCRRLAKPDQIRFKLQDGAELDALFEHHVIKSNRDEFMAWKLKIGGDITDFIYPLQQIAAE